MDKAQSYAKYHQIPKEIHLLLLEKNRLHMWWQQRSDLPNKTNFNRVTGRLCQDRQAFEQSCLQFVTANVADGVVSVEYRLN